MQASKRSAIIGDIGGTHARFAICDIDRLSVKHFAVFETKMFASLPDAVSHYLEAVPLRPDMAAFAVADRLIGREIGIDNAAWKFTAEEVQNACGVERLQFVNNFAALALCLPYLNAHDRRQIKDGRAVDDAPKIVLGAGGEFGAAILIETSGKQVALTGQAGQTAFSATNERELALLSMVSGEYGYAPLQAILSARGLETIHALLSSLEGLPEPALPAVEIIALALKEDDALARETLEFFVSILARVAGDLAMFHDARGGIYLGRGIIPRILPLLDSDFFREVLTNKGSASADLAAIPVHAILANDAGLRGAAIALSERFPMDSAY